MAATVQLRARFAEECTARNWKSASAQARGLGISPSTMWRVLEGINAPGTTFIAGALRAFPDLTFTDLFDIVDDDLARESEDAEEMSA